jgi:hypothetical protein
MQTSYARVVEIDNPFNPWETMVTHEVVEHLGVTVHEWLRLRWGKEFNEFPYPTICYINGTPVMRDDWDHRIVDGDLIQFYRIAGDVVSIVIAVVALLVAVVTLLLLPPPVTPGGQPAPDPVFARRGQFNRTRMGEPIEVVYGRCRLFPSYAGRSYNLYQDNEQYQYNLLCVGQGYFDIDVDTIRIDDTPITDYPDVEYQLIEPYGDLTLFSNNVATSSEVGGIEMLGPNEVGYEDIGPFTVVDVGDTADKLEFDTICPSGLYATNKKGGLANATVVFVFEYRTIDDTGAPLDSWTSLGTETLTTSSTTPQRRTWSYDVPAGRYEVRGRRTNDKSDSPRIQHLLQWQAARAFLPNATNFGEVTMLAIKIRASNNLNDNSRSLFNLDATRKLPTYNPMTEVWSAPVATRSIVWAFCDVFRAQYGGGALGRFLHAEQLASLEDFYDERGDYFDWVFDQKTTVLEAAKAVARCGRAVPMMIGSQMGIVRDSPATVPSAIFGPDNIVKGSFRREFSFFEFDSYDSVRVTYRDFATWKEETVLCILPGDSSSNPDSVTLAGCTSREQAYREGMFIAASTRLHREKVSFQTGMEGHIPTFGDMISVSHDLIRVGVSGVVFDVTTDHPVAGKTALLVSDPVDFGSPAATRVMVLRKKDGSVHGPFNIEQFVVDSEVDPQYVVVASADINLSHFYFDDENERPIYQAGVAERFAKLYKVQSLKPTEGETVGVECVTYDPRTHSFDDYPVPALPIVYVPEEIPDLPTVTGLRVTQTPEETIVATVAWNAALGASTYRLQKSYDNTTWDDVITTAANTYVMSVTPGVLYLRVAGIGVGQGTWATWTGTLGVPLSVPAAPIGLALVGTWVLDLDLSWEPGLGDGFDLYILNDSTDAILRVVDLGNEDLTYQYTRALAVADAAPRTIRAELVAVNLAGDSTATTLVITNPIPDAPTALSEGTPTGTSYPVSWTHANPADMIHYKVYASTTPGFTPGPGNLVDTVTPLSSTVVAAVTTYWRVSAMDVWGTEEAMSAEKTITV